MKNLILILLTVSSVFAQTRKKQTTQYLTLNTYVRDTTLQKPFKIGYLAYTPVEKCILVNKKVWAYHCLNDATIKVTSTQNLIKHIKECDPNAKSRVTYYSTGGHDGSWGNGLKTDSVFKYFLK